MSFHRPCCHHHLAAIAIDRAATITLLPSPSSRSGSSANPSIQRFNRYPSSGLSAIQWLRLCQPSLLQPFWQSGSLFASSAFAFARLRLRHGEDSGGDHLRGLRTRNRQIYLPRVHLPWLRTVHAPMRSVRDGPPLQSARPPGGASVHAQAPGTG